MPVGVGLEESIIEVPMPSLPGDGHEVSLCPGDGVVISSAGKRDGKWVPRDLEARPGPNTSILHPQEGRGGGGGGRRAWSRRWWYVPSEDELVSGEHRRHH